MDYLATLMVAEPSGFWATLITFFEGIFNSYVLGIILLTIIIKLVLSPLDFMNKKLRVTTHVCRRLFSPRLPKFKKNMATTETLSTKKLQNFINLKGSVWAAAAL